MSNYIDNIVKNAVTYDLVSKPLAKDMANEFSIQSTYAVGDYVMHDYKLYKCISAVSTAGNWNSAKWQECKIGDEINGGVKFTAQTLTSEQKAQARNNIGGASQADLEALNAVRYDQAQTLTTAQKTQARANIGAVSQEEATPDAIRYSAQSLTDAQKNQARVNVGTVASTSIAEEFSTSKAYAVGDMVMYDSKLYKFKTAHSAGAWNNAQVDAVSVKEEISSLSNDLSENKSINRDILISVLHDVAWADGSGLRRIDMLRQIFDDVIPNKYMLLDYIESNSTKFVNTGVLSQNPLTIEIAYSLDLKVFDFTTPSGTVYPIREYGPIIVGGISNNSRGRFYFAGVVHNSGFPYGAQQIDPMMHGYRIGQNNWNEIEEITYKKNAIMRVKAIISPSTITYIANNEVIASNTTPTNVDYGAELYLFRSPIVYLTPEYPEEKQCRVYSLLMSVNNVNVFEGIPVYDKSNGISGLYDIVNQAFHPLVDSE